MKETDPTWAELILSFLDRLDLDESILPKGIHPMYPLKGENSAVTQRIVSAFYNKFYNDHSPRQLVIGINPGRLGAGATGLPFTDTKRLTEHCGIPLEEINTYEPSSVFVYEVIDAFGGPEAFYRKFYVTSVSPVGFVEEKPGGKLLNYNYYDSKELEQSIIPYVKQKLEEQLGFGANTDRAYCLGTGKNFKFLKALNEEMGYFKKVVPLEHPRYVMQYKNKQKERYIDKYLKALAAF